MNKAAIFCGSRGITSRDRAAEIMMTWAGGAGGRIVITGGAPGADALFHDVASNLHAVQTFVVPAQWDIHGKPAGHIRNRRMLETLLGLRDRGYVVAVIALVDGVITPGTANMTSIARMAGVSVTVHTVAGAATVKGELL